MSQLNVQLLLTGDELMTGDVIDTNSIKVSDALMSLGIVLARKVVVGDQLSSLIAEIESMSEQADVLIVNGGLGPTIDDLTAEALAKVVGEPLAEHPQALAELTRWCDRRNYPLNGPNKKQALLPQGVDIISNENGSAPGFSVTHNDCLVMCTPGVPSELSRMLTTGVMPMIKSMSGEGVAQVVKFNVFGVGESSVQRMLTQAYPQWPQEIELGFRADFPTLEVKLTARTSLGVAILSEWEGNIHNALAAHVIGKGRIGLAEATVESLLQNALSMTLAESCTGGLIASHITSVAGSSQVFEAGIVSYSNAVKQSILGVSTEALEAHGAVSESVVLQMAKGALSISGADLVVAVSGVAGPSGGSSDKPVGTCWIAWGTGQALKTKRVFYPADRVQFQQYISAIALDLIRREALKISDAPYYFSKDT